MTDGDDLLIIGDGPGAGEAARAAAGRGLRIACASPREVPGGAPLAAGWPWPFLAPEAATPLPESCRNPDSGAFLAGGGLVFTGHAGVGAPVRPRRLALAPRLRPARPSWWSAAFGVAPPPPGGGPGRVLVVGAGQTGVEIAAAWADGHREVVLLEAAARILPGWDPDLAATAQAALEAAGVIVCAGRRVVAVEDTNGVTLTMRTGQGHPDRRESGDLAVPALGWRPVLGGLGLERTRVLCDRDGFVEVDSRLATAEPGLHALGAAVALPLSPSAVARQAMLLADVAAGGTPPPLRQALAPRVIRRPVPLLAVGLSAAGAAARGFRADCGTARGSDGAWVRCVRDAETGAVLGVQAAGPGADDLAVPAAALLESAGGPGAGSVPGLLAAACERAAMGGSHG